MRPSSKPISLQLARRILTDCVRELPMSEPTSTPHRHALRPRRSCPSGSRPTSTSGCSSSRSAARSIPCHGNCWASAASSPTSSGSISRRGRSGAAGEATRRKPRRRPSATAPISPTVAEATCSATTATNPTPRRLTEVVNAYKPEILLLGATTLGRDLAGSVATTLLTGLTADCTELDVDADGSLAATRPTFGGSLLCTIYTLNYRPQMATVRPRVHADAGAGRAARGAGSSSIPSVSVEADIVTKVLCASSRTASPQSRTSPTPTSWWRAGSGSDRRKISNWCGSSRPCSARNSAARGRWCRRAG